IVSRSAADCIQRADPKSPVSRSAGSADHQSGCRPISRMRNFVVHSSRAYSRGQRGRAAHRPLRAARCPISAIGLRLVRARRLRGGMARIDTISKAEAIKQQSRQLRGNLACDLTDTASPFDNAGYSLLKFHGVYQGYDRDSATERKQRGEDKLWQFMVRVRIPGGRLTAEQYLALDALADRYANGSLRITTRQSIQFHGVVKAGLKSTIAEIDA